jgi:iron complex outermembrane receptor protein
LLLGQFVNAQTSIEGKVFDALNNQPLAGATIMDISGLSGTVTNAQGYFIWDLEDSISEIDISYIGYNPRRISIIGAKFLNIGLQHANTELQEVVISAYRNGERYQDIPGSISLITVKDIERGEAVAITPSLNRIPSVYMHSGALNTNRITIRGVGSRSPFSTTKIRAYLSEIPLTSGTGETTIEDIDLDIIDRVEVIKGPSSSIYGAGLGGTINYGVKKSPYRNTSFSAGSKIGSFGLLGYSGSFQHGSDAGNVNFSINDLHSDGYRENNEYDRQSTSLAGQLYTGKKGVMTLIGNWIELKAFIPSSIDSTTYQEDPRSAAFTWQQVEGFEDYSKSLIGLNYEYDITEEWMISASTFISKRDAYELRPFNTLNEESNANGFRAFTGFGNTVNRLISKFNLGFEYFNEDYDWQTLDNDLGTLLSNNQEDRKYYNIFSQVDLSFSSKTKLILGVNVNNTSYQIKDLYNTVDSLNTSGKYSFETQFSPRIALIHKLDPQHSLFANISHGFSPPTLEETLTPEGQVNPDIQPESGYNFEIGSRGTFVTNRLFYDVSVYTMRIENLLVARRVQDDIFIGVNAGKTTHSGLDVALNYKLISSLHSFWSSANVFATYMYADYLFKEFVDGEDDYSGNELTGTPPHKLNIGLDFSTNFGVYGTLEYQFVDEMPMNDANSAYSDNYSLLNIKLGLREKFGRSDQLELDLYAGINNILDTKYASMISVNAPSFGGRPPRYYYPGLPINYYGGVKLEYKF